MISEIAKEMETRSQTVCRHVAAYLNETRTSMESFAEDVMQAYHTLPEGLRDVKFHAGGDVYRDMRANAQIVRRFIEGNPRMPVDIEESLVLALPDDRRQPLLRDLAMRYGLLAAPVPSSEPGDDACAISRLMKETAEAIEAIAPMMADGRIDHQDAPLAEHALVQINEAMAELMSLQARITEILPADAQVVARLVPMK